MESELINNTEFSTVDSGGNCLQFSFHECDNALHLQRADNKVKKTRGESQLIALLFTTT